MSFRRLAGPRIKLIRIVDGTNKQCVLWTDRWSRPAGHEATLRRRIYEAVACLVSEGPLRKHHGEGRIDAAVRNMIDQDAARAAMDILNLFCKLSAGLQN